MRVSGTGCSCLQKRQKKGHTHTHSRVHTRAQKQLRTHLCECVSICAFIYNNMPQSCAFVFKLNVCVTRADARREACRGPSHGDIVLLCIRQAGRQAGRQTLCQLCWSRAVLQLVMKWSQQCSQGWHIPSTGGGWGCQGYTHTHARALTTDKGHNGGKESYHGGCDCDFVLFFFFFLKRLLLPGNVSMILWDCKSSMVLSLIP